MGAVKTDPKWGSIIQLSGDNRRPVAKFLMEEGIATKEEIKIHGVGYALVKAVCAIEVAAAKHPWMVNHHPV